MLFGFDFKVQHERVDFNHVWAAAFLSSRFTNDEVAQQVFNGDTAKIREAKYGNNIAVLFRGLHHCRQYYDHPAFWQAIARGMNTNLELVRKTAHVLSDARRFLRDAGRPGSTRSDTVRAADAWIDFLSANPAARLRLSPSTDDRNVIRFSEYYFRSLEHTMVNASSIPTRGHPQLPPIRDSITPDTKCDRDASKPAPKPQVDSPKPARHIMSPPKLSIKTEALASTTDKISKDGNQRIDAQASRKRSPPPLDASQEPAPKRVQHAQLSGDTPAEAPQPTKAPPAAPIPEEQPQNHPEQTPTLASAKQASSWSNMNSNQIAENSPVSLTARGAELRERLAVLEKKLAESQDQLKVTSMKNIESKVSELQAETKKGLVTTMDSMHAVAEAMVNMREGISGPGSSVINTVNAIKEDIPNAHSSIIETMNSFKEEVSGSHLGIIEAVNAIKGEVSRPHQSMVDAMNTFKEEMSGSDSRITKALLQPIQTMTETCNSLRHEVAELKPQQSQASAQSPASQIQSQMVELLQEQSVQLKKLGLEMERVQAKLASSAHANPANQTPIKAATPPIPAAINVAFAKPAHATAGLEDTKPKPVASPPIQPMRSTFTYPASAPSPLANPAVAKPALSRPVPKDLLQAMEAAEKDLKHHVKSIQKFYYQLDSSLQNRRATEKAADLLLALEQALEHAEVGQKQLQG